jgi:DNA-binding transcriptional ArsR family regulator
MVKQVRSIPGSEIDFGAVSEMLKAMAHPERVAIIDLLCNCGSERLTVKFIYGQLHMPQSVASKHLGIMKRSGLLKRETERNYTYYRLNFENALTARIAACFTKPHD